jgi:hypothetical protein
MRGGWRCAMLLVWTCLIGPGGRAQNATTPPAGQQHYSRRQIAAVKTAAPPVIDGDLSDACWQTAPKAETFVDDQNGVPVEDQTTVYLLYDATYIYIGFRCRDSHPEGIVARETVRDSKYQGNYNTEDNVEVQFDPFLTYKGGDRSVFSLNALGTRSAQYAGGRANKVEWQGDWDGAARRTADGWTAEMRIPWKSLNYPTGKPSLDMGIDFTRYQTRTKLGSIWSYQGTQGFLELEGQWRGVQPPQGAFRRHLSLLPYLLPGNRHYQPDLHAGLDARYTLTPQLTAIGTINPDFSTVENALTSIQFSRAEQIAPEARPFFLEGGDNFNLSQNLNILGNYFLSQRIPGFDFGTKLYGKLTPDNTLGFLHTTAFGHRDDLALALVHSLAPTSTVNFYFGQMSASNDNNTVGAAVSDTRWGKLELNSQLALTSGNSAGGDGKQVAVAYFDKLNVWAFGYGEVSPHFRDADGYFAFADNRTLIAQAAWSAQWRKGFWRDFNAQVTPQYTWHYSGLPFQRGATANVQFDTRSDWGIGFDTNYTRFDAQTDNTYGFTLTSGVSNRFRQWGFYVQAGRLADRPSLFVGPHFSVRVFRKLDIGFNGAIQNHDGVTQQHILTLNYVLSPTRSVGGRMVIQTGHTNWYGFYRNSGGRGTNLYFILGDPNAQQFVKQVSCKMVFAL